MDIHWICRNQGLCVKLSLIRGRCLAWLDNAIIMVLIEVQLSLLHSLTVLLTVLIALCYWSVPMYLKQLLQCCVATFKLVAVGGAHERHGLVDPPAEQDQAHWKRSMWRSRPRAADSRSSRASKPRSSTTSSYTSM